MNWTVSSEDRAGEREEGEDLDGESVVVVVKGEER